MLNNSFTVHSKPLCFPFCYPTFEGTLPLILLFWHKFEEGFQKVWDTSGICSWIDVNLSCICSATSGCPFFNVTLAILLKCRLKTLNFWCVSLFYLRFLFCLLFCFCLFVEVGGWVTLKCQFISSLKHSFTLFKFYHLIITSSNCQASLVNCKLQVS